MKKTGYKFIFGTIFSLAMIASAASCNRQQQQQEVETDFDFTISLASGRRNKLYVGDPDRIVVHEINKTGQESYQYKVTTSGGDEYLEVSSNGALTVKKALEAGKTVAVRVTEANSELSRNLYFEISDHPGDAKGGFNYASDEDARLDILGELEEYAMENYLTGITLFENGGYVRYANANDKSQNREDTRVVHLANQNYITGYGFGLLREGYIEGRLKNGSSKYPDYMHTATTSDPANINAWNATGSQVSSLNGYISASYWSTRIDAKDPSKYEWYPLLAKDTVDGKPFNVPVHLEDDNDLNMYRKWRVYVKTGASDGLKYRINSSKRSEFNNRLVELEDYAFTYQMLLSEPCALTRGTELATDTSYGIKGGSTFHRNSKGKNGDEITTLWNNMVSADELGIHIGSDSNGEYIDIELINPIDEFTAMYTLSSNLYTPIPREFIEAISPDGDYISGAELFGSFTDSDHITDNTIAIGPYFLEDWIDGSQIVFKRNDEWYEVNETTYRIPGINEMIYTSGTEQPDFLYNYFLNGELDSTGIPSTRMSEKLTSDLNAKGDSTFKLNVNSCTQERWNEIFGEKAGGKDNDYLVKPWMSNKNFLNGLFWSIDRKSFADKRGVAPSINYFSDAYLSDPKSGNSYNNTTQHQNAIKNFHDAQNEDYGYNLSKAVTYFQMAVDELASAGDLRLGTKSNPTIIKIHIRWMNQSDPKEYGQDIADFFTKAFNNDAVCGGAVKLEVDQEAVVQWQQVYNDYLMTGKYDLGFGAISGNTYNPLNFLEVLKSDNSSGFTLNWGNDTSKVDETFPIEYAGRSWSFDALWAAADHGTVANGGRDVDPVEHCYLTTPTDLDGVSTNDLYNGCRIVIPFNFVELDDAETILQVSKIQLYLGGAGSLLLTSDQYTVDYDEKKIIITLTAEKASAINELIVTGNKLDEAAEDISDADQKFSILHPFTYQKYGIWEVEVYYTLQIGGVISETVKYAFKNKTAEDQSKKNLALASF